ncbi:2Fe-2S iron-sulfur cluster-binding protein [Alishewanella sp. d11]|uniref:2Fe-2S iron-sulfur cluster-binding protein n=1 Tax=Alishewanella sp. d11 TaxID=3414030 RepID=UPI003BF8A232
MSFQVKVLPAKLHFTVENNETILQAALRQGIDFPYRCQQGVCTSCVCKLRAGSVHYVPPSPLTELDQQQAFVYCCLAYADSDLELHHPFIRG